MWNFGVTGSIDHLQEVRNSSYEYHRGRIDSQGPSDISIGGWDGPLSGVFLSEVSIGSIGEQWSKGIVAWKWKNGIGWFATKNTQNRSNCWFSHGFPMFSLGSLIFDHIWPIPKSPMASPRFWPMLNALWSISRHHFGVPSHWANPNIALLGDCGRESSAAKSGSSKTGWSRN